jgi:rare lipoprotein A
LQKIEILEMKKMLLYIVFAISLVATAHQNKNWIDGDEETENLTLYKENAHASYYSDKFNGRRTASGKKFDNEKLTAAHKKLPFGTKLKITNERNNKSVIVEVTDRGPFVNGREIDLSKKAFMDLATNKKSGAMNVKIEIVEN